MSQDRKQQVSGVIEAPPERVFALLADPNQHTTLDGAGMLRGVEGQAQPLTAVGDSFVMNMDQEGLGEYRIRNEVTAFEPDQHIAWAPAIHPPGSMAHILGSLDFTGYFYDWRLEATGAGHTKVTQTCDWSAVADEQAAAMFPRVSTAQMEGTIGRIGEALR